MSGTRGLQVPGKSWRRRKRRKRKREGAAEALVPGEVPRKNLLQDLHEMCLLATANKTTSSSEIL